MPHILLCSPCVTVPSLGAEPRRERGELGATQKIKVRGQGAGGKGSRGKTLSLH